MRAARRRLYILINESEPDPKEGLTMDGGITAHTVLMIALPSVVLLIALVILIYALRKM